MLIDCESTKIGTLNMQNAYKPKGADQHLLSSCFNFLVSEEIK